MPPEGLRGPPGGRITATGVGIKVWSGKGGGWASFGQKKEMMLAKKSDVIKFANIALDLPAPFFWGGGWVVISARDAICLRAMRLDRVMAGGWGDGRRGSD